MLIVIIKRAHCIFVRLSVPTWGITFTSSNGVMIIVIIGSICGRAFLCVNLCLFSQKAHLGKPHFYLLAHWPTSQQMALKSLSKMIIQLIFLLFLPLLSTVTPSLHLFLSHKLWLAYRGLCVLASWPRLSQASLPMRTTRGPHEGNLVRQRNRALWHFGSWHHVGPKQASFGVAFTVPI